ncbi:hypothetical protein NUW54_g14715 [Trametes sanguinea]|uniref:Uncharacterized protein n=1 Tax=Trametes sanguinea TaxID=158606 RepID=A0ACC1MBY8_9APHY|nr:hypothetical protein NUW54_g14715 [Trametes sanguinea]
MGQQTHVQPEGASVAAEGHALDGAFLGARGDGGGELADVVVCDVPVVLVEHLHRQRRRVRHVLDLP